MRTRSGHRTTAPYKTLVAAALAAAATAYARTEQETGMGPINLLVGERVWEKSDARAKGGVRWTDDGVLHVSGPAHATYRRPVPLANTRWNMSVGFPDTPEKDAVAEIAFEGVFDRKRRAAVRIDPDGETMMVCGRERSFRRLPENPYSYELEIVITNDRLTLFWGGRQMGSADVTVLGETGAVLVGAENTTVTVDRLVCVPLPGAKSAIDATAFPDLAVTVRATEENALAAPWVEYFGTHYARVVGKDADVRYSVARGYGKPHVGVTRDPAKRATSPERIGPFTGKPIRLALRDFRGQGRFARPDDPSAEEFFPEILEHDITAMYGLGIAPSGESGKEDVFDKDLAYWTVRLIHERWPELRHRLIWQIGNELLSGHWNPRNYPKDQLRVPPLAGVPEEMWNAGYDIRWKLSFYVEKWLGPAVECIRRASQDVYGDPGAIRIAFGSLNPYGRENVWFVEQLMASTFEGTLAPSLAGEPVWKHVEMLTVHYMFDIGGPHHVFGVAENRARMDHYVDAFVRSGKLGGVWLTEGHGRAGKGPTTILKTATRFLDWVVDNGLTGRQAKQVWWGEGDRAGGSGQDLMRRLGTYFGKRQLHYTCDVRNDVKTVSVLGIEGDIADRLLVCIFPGGRGDKVDVADLTVDLAGGFSVDGWQGTAVQYSDLVLPQEKSVDVRAEGDVLRTPLGRRILEPLVVWLARTK